MHSITTLSNADIDALAAIRVALARLGAYHDPALLWHVGERHTDDDDPQLLADERLGWLLCQPRQRD